MTLIVIKNMVNICNSDEKDTIMEFLSENYVVNTFIIADIENYGFNKEYMKVFSSGNEQGKCRGIALQFYNNLIITGKFSEHELQELNSFLKDGIDTVMGEYNAVSEFKKALNRKNLKIEEKYIYSLNKLNKFYLSDKEYKIADLNDVEKVYNYLMSIPEFKIIYKEKNMIVNRIKTGDGIHLYFENENGEIYAHINSAACTGKTCMLGGLAVKEECRNKGTAHEIAALISELNISKGIIPCVFASETDNLFADLGYEKTAKWGTMNIS